MRRAPCRCSGARGALLLRGLGSVSRLGAGRAPPLWISSPRRRQEALRCYLSVCQPAPPPNQLGSRVWLIRRHAGRRLRRPRAQTSRRASSRREGKQLRRKTQNLMIYNFLMIHNIITLGEYKTCDTRSHAIYGKATSLCRLRCRLMIYNMRTCRQHVLVGGKHGTNSTIPRVHDARANG